MISNIQQLINDEIALAMGRMQIELIAARVHAQAEADRANRAEAALEATSAHPNLHERSAP